MTASMLRLASLERACAALPSTWMVVQWHGVHVWKVGSEGDGRSKMFAVLSPEGHRGDAVDGVPSSTVTLKVREERLPFLTDLPRISRAPHLPRGGWLQFGAGVPFDDEDMAAYLADSHAIVAATPPKHVRASLGL